MIFQIKVIVFIVVSAAFAWVSRNSLRAFHSHGFFRFFAWETILILILLNIDYWFYNAFNINQLISWVLLTISLYLLIHGIHSLRNEGKPDSKRNDPLLMGIEKTTELVTVGAYRHIRHPLYSSLLFLAWGVFFKHITWVCAFWVVVTTLLLTLTAKIDEIENIHFFGAAYEKYMKRSKMFIPFLF